MRVKQRLCWSTEKALDFGAGLWYLLCSKKQKEVKIMRNRKIHLETSRKYVPGPAFPVKAGLFCTLPSEHGMTKEG